MTMLEWLRLGIEKGWCTDSYCWSHDNPDMTDEEITILDTDGEVCFPVMRLWI